MKMIRGVMPPELEIDETSGVLDTLSSDTISAADVEDELRRLGFLDAGLGVAEHQMAEDPIVAILEHPEHVVTEADGTEICIIDDMLKSAHRAFASLGPMYTECEKIQSTMKDLIASKDTHAKQVVLLCMIALDKGLQAQLGDLYPHRGPGRQRLDDFVVCIKAQIEEIFNVAYVNVARPSLYNVDELINRFLASLTNDYKG